MTPLTVRNRQRACRVNLPFLRRLAKCLLEDFFKPEEAGIAIHLVAAPEMTRVNEQFLKHAGSTDVITFDYSDPDSHGLLSGELFICLDEARINAKRFRTTWQSELARYLIHGLLHLQGYDDRVPSKRRKMKREENRILREVSRRLALRSLATSPKSS